MAAVVLASWEKELDWTRFKAELARGYREDDHVAAAPVGAGGGVPIAEAE